MHFRPADTPDIIEIIEKLATRIWHEHYTPIIGMEQVLYMLERFQSAQAMKRQIREEAYHYYLVEDERGLPVGYFSFKVSDDALFISKLYLDAPYRRKGYGRKMVRFIEQSAREQDIGKLLLTVNRHNHTAIRAYKRLGFLNAGEIIQDIGNGFVMDDYQFEKDVVKLDILYRDASLVAVNKPSGLLVHRSMIDRYESDFAMQILRDQIGQYVYPVHRLDKPTSGVLLFALSSETAKQMSGLIEKGEMEKRYLAVVRGYTDEAGIIDYPLKEQLDKMTDAKADQDKPAQSAVTHYQRVGTVELAHPVGRYATARYSLVSLTPKTGRKHQLRRHMKHILHPIVGDTRYGRTEHNNLFRNHYDIHRLLLHADTLRFTHPVTQERLIIKAPLEAKIKNLFDTFGWRSALAAY